jgi:N-acetyl-anhydromuramyl-L-alanine amidase AmpD
MNLQEQISRMKSMMNLNESDKRKIWLLRRLETQDIKDYLDEQIYSLTDEISPCGYSTAEKYLDEVLEVTVSNFINHFSDELYDDEDMMEIDMLIWEIVNHKYRSYIINQFDGRICDDDDEY